MSLPEVGKTAPAFTLLNQDGEQVSLKDYKGKKNVLLYFYPKAMTPGCITQACGIRDVKQEFDELDTVVLGVSPDPVKKLTNFIEKKELNFDLLSDEDHQVAELYGCWGLKKFMGKEFMGLIRTSFVISKTGELVHIMNKFKTKTHHDDALAYLREHLA
jgi:peroxiredoxin Q/BCP